MQTKRLLIAVTVALTALIMVGGWYKNHDKNRVAVPNTLFGVTLAPRYHGSIAVEKLAKHLTSNEKEQKVIAEFLYNFEDVFHADLYVLFQNTEYLIVFVVSEEDQIKNLGFIFTNNEPIEGENALYWNGQIKYEVILWNNKTHYQSWYTRSSKDTDWSNRAEYSYSPDCWYKIIDLSKFDWYQLPQP